MSLIATRDKCSQISIYYSNGCVNAVWKSIYVIPFSFIDMFKRFATKYFYQTALRVLWFRVYFCQGHTQNKNAFCLISVERFHLSAKEKNKNQSKTLQLISFLTKCYIVIYLHCFHFLLSFKAISSQRKVLDQYRLNFPIYYIYRRTKFPLNYVSIHTASSIKTIIVII